MLLIYNDTKIYIACPAAVATGGPELLHQLCYNLRNVLNSDAYMYYYPTNLEKPVHPYYIKYGNYYTTEIEDDEKNILIVPEIRSGMELLNKYNKIRKAVWFLSINNYYLSRLSKQDFFMKRVINKILKLMNKRPIFEIDIDTEMEIIKKIDIANDNMLTQVNLIMVNSYRGLYFLKSKGFNPVYLSEYLNEDFFNNTFDINQKEDIIVYNPKKGYSFTKKIIRYAKSIKFFPIENMSRNEVIELLKKAKVYIDFGNHPGKDRLPREAAMLGCCVITGKRGSAAYFEDVPIPDEYKFEDEEGNIPLIVDKIKECLINYKDKVKDFESYRDYIQKEREKFIEDLKKIFIKRKW